MLLLALMPLGLWAATDYIANVYGRDYRLLNGKWAAIVDLYDAGGKMEIYKNKTAAKPEEFYEYSLRTACASMCRAIGTRRHPN